jgi:O-antigen ligase
MRPESAQSFGGLENGGLFGNNKQLASGRQVIWPAIIAVSGEAPLMGHGLGSQPGSYLAWPYNGRSAHNGFLQVYFQFGLLGLGVYVLMWVLLFVRAIETTDPLARAHLVAVVCAACILETFEVFLIQNQFGIGVSFAILMTTSLRPAAPSALSL